ncbi:MAG TPA: hypothetical protein VG796_28335 [Verrucomicrobiales bacterium]|nr:hypothetical protein [Verrucomicrobiales bacterium]
MDTSVWLPWAWGAGAVVCGIALCLLQPWRRQFQTARLAWQGNRWLWIVPAGAAAAELLWRWRASSLPSSEPLINAGLNAGESLVSVLTWITRGDVLAMLLAAAFFANSAGLRQGLWKGIAEVFAPGWQRILRLALLASATAALGMPMARFGAGGEAGRLAVKLMAALWTSTAATLLMCGLMLAFESACRARAKAPRMRFAEMTGQYTARLWLPVLAGTVAFPLMDLLNESVLTILCVYAWPLVALLAWFPLAAMRSTEAGDIHTVVSVALRRWGTGLPALTGWLAVAGTSFFALHLAFGGLLSLCPEGSWWRAAVTVFAAGVRAWLAVWMLGAWVAIQVDMLPSAAKVARASRRQAPA